MTGKIAELRIPADSDYILLAKRSSVAFGSIYGLDIEALDELSIAVTQACENAIALTHEWLTDCVAELRIEFALSADTEGIEVRVRAVCPSEKQHRADDTYIPEPEPLPAPQHRVRSYEPARPVEIEPTREEVTAMCDMGLQLMQLFVDDCLYRVDEQRHGLNIRLTKYRLI